MPEKHSFPPVQPREPEVPPAETNDEKRIDRRYELDVDHLDDCT